MKVKLGVLMLVGVLVIGVMVANAQAESPRSGESVQAAMAHAFTYQGVLRDNGQPASGAYDFLFILYDANLGGSQVGPIVSRDDMTVTQGLFNVTLDFGDVFNGAQYYLDISVRPGASTGSYTPLAPRQPLTAVPYASGVVLPLNETIDSGGTGLAITNLGTGQAAGFDSASSFVSLFVSNSGAGGALRADTSSNGTGSAVTGYNYGNDRYAAELEIIKNTNPRAAIYARTAGTGQGIDAEVNSNTTADAIFARTTSSLAGSYAAVFSGPVQVSCSAATCNTTNALQVTGNFAATVKSFKIDHPLDPAHKYLNHISVESPDMKNIYDGVITTDANGLASVVLPDYFEALNQDFRYQLTVMGTFAQAIVKDEIANNRFTIQTDKPNVKVSWQVTGIRHDAYAKAYPVPVEQDKPRNEQGTYLYPELFGQPASKGVDWVEPPVKAAAPAEGQP